MRYLSHSKIGYTCCGVTLVSPSPAVMPVGVDRSVRQEVEDRGVFVSRFRVPADNMYDRDDREFTHLHEASSVLVMKGMYWKVCLN
jgi:hypothetical protein